MNDGARFVGSGAYVLDALDRAERDEFDAQLLDSEDLRGEVTELADTAVLLGLAVDPVVPSSQLRDSILDRIATLPQLPREVSDVRELRPARTGVGTAVGDRARARWFARPVAIVVAAAAAIIVGGVGVAATLGQASTRNQADALASIEAAPDSQRAAAAVSTEGTATLVWSAKLGKSALILNGLPTLPGGKTYELWYIDPTGTPTGAGLFEATGSRTWRVLDGALSTGVTVGVTVEPAGGSKAPTTKPIVAIPAT